MKLAGYDYQDAPQLWLSYECGATFIRVCETCGRIVRANDTINVNASGLKDEPNAVCSTCGPTKMLFQGFV